MAGFYNVGEWRSVTVLYMLAVLLEEWPLTQIRTRDSGRLQLNQLHLKCFLYAECFLYSTATAVLTRQSGPTSLVASSHKASAQNGVDGVFFCTPILTISMWVLYFSIPQLDQNPHISIIAACTIIVSLALLMSCCL